MGAEMCIRDRYSRYTYNEFCNTLIAVKRRKTFRYADLTSAADVLLLRVLSYLVLIVDTHTLALCIHTGRALWDTSPAHTSYKVLDKGRLLHLTIFC